MGVLRIDSTFYKLCDMASIPNGIDFAKENRIQDDVFGTYCYFGIQHRFSNFNSTPLMIDGIPYMNGEQYIEAEKCRLCEDKETLHEIMNCCTPWGMKELGKSPKGHDESKWRIKAPDVAYTFCKAKFHEYPEYGQTLIKTYPLLIAEATTERPWGCGMGLREQGVSNSKNWKEQGIMGITLERVRSELMEEFGLPRNSGAQSAAHSFASLNNSFDSQTGVKEPHDGETDMDATNQSQTTE